VRWCDSLSRSRIGARVLVALQAETDAPLRQVHGAHVRRVDARPLNGPGSAGGVLQTSGGREASMNLFELRVVSRSYETANRELCALHGVSLSIPGGEMCA